MEIFTIKNLSFGYKGSVSKAIDTLTLSINEGDFVIVAGRSGCGKTTLLKMLKPQLTPVGNKSGDIQFFGEDILSC
ncbi:MAG: ATP-binding cassette domain-containing protein, partial [Clostridia bacterium]